MLPPLTALQSHLLYGGALIAVSIALLAFVTSELTRNYSQVDKLWSIVPPVFAWYFAMVSGWMPRLVLMAVLVTAWSARLTFNFWRRGGYAWPPWTGVEDYRWAVLRANPLLAGPWRWRLFNLGFVSLYQVLLLLLITLPSVAAADTVQPLNWLDAVAAILFLGFLLLETVADQQQYDFQTEKHRRRARRRAARRRHGARLSHDRPVRTGAASELRRRTGDLVFVLPVQRGCHRAVDQLVGSRRRAADPALPGKHGASRKRSPWPSIPSMPSIAAAYPASSPDSGAVARCSSVARFESSSGCPD